MKLEMFLPIKPTCREDLLPLCEELRAELDRAGEILTEAFERCRDTADA